MERHKARLQAELTRARLQRGSISLVALKEKLENDRRIERPRGETVLWVRINTLKTNVDQQLSTCLEGFRQVKTLSELEGDESNRYYLDEHVPDLIAFPVSTGITKIHSYHNGELILQDKASCFPAHLLLGSDSPSHGDVLDACAAPGNKTTHLAMLKMRCRGQFGANKARGSSKIFACERDPQRSKTLINMVKLAGAENAVTVMENQDFLAINPNDPCFRNVTHMLLDPSCSGSGITDREDIPDLALPSPPKRPGSHYRNDRSPIKRKAKSPAEVPRQDIAAIGDVRDSPVELVDESRLRKLSNLQTHIIDHAFSFPAATRITYSTCSIYAIENENVVARALKSERARTRQWRVMTRIEQPPGLKKWPTRGLSEAHGLTRGETEACLRCEPGGEQRTIGFFVCGFVRGAQGETNGQDGTRDEDDDEEQWEGFSDIV